MKKSILLHHPPLLCLIIDPDPENAHARGQSGQIQGIDRMGLFDLFQPLAL
jgi:hypothetical protein